MVPSYILFVLCILFSLKDSYSQTIDPYRRFTDPRAITYLDGPDAEPLHYRCGVGWPGERDPIDSYFVLAKGEGAGILTHIWMQMYNLPDSIADLKIYIDDSLVAHDYLYLFFKRPIGPFRPPFDSLQSGGMVCDVQMPFKKNFKITFYSSFDNCCLFWAIAWRPVLDPVHVEVFSSSPSEAAEAQQKAAEAVYWSGESPWQNTPMETVSVEKELTLATPIEEEFTGPGMITEIYVKPSSYDADALRNVWLQFYWDGSPDASVDVPLADFFGVGAGMRNVHAHPIRAQKDGVLTSYFPMPFAVKGKIRIINKSANPIGLSLTCKYSREPIDRDRVGYFQAQFNEKKSLRYNVYHPVGYHQGRGRFVGMQLYLPVWEPGYFLEGDPIFHIDSNRENFIRYTGTEDYFNGGWFFIDGPFSLPFAGCTEIHTSLYRFHYMDAIDYKSSFELLLQHGTKNDFKAWYRTISYFYNQWTPFWVSRDTVRQGEEIKISGTGYNPGESILIKLDETTLGMTNADPNGAFDLTQTITASTLPGGYVLSINGSNRPKPIWITSGPDVYFVRDTFPAYVNWKDSVTVYGTGFSPKSKVSIYLDTMEMLYSESVTTDALGQFSTKVLVPYMADGEYNIIAQTNPSQRAVSNRKLQCTRIYNFEIENMLPPVIQEGHARQDYMGYFNGVWSEQYYLLYIGEPGQKLVVQFWVPIADTFAVTLYLTNGARFGDHDVALDYGTPVPFIGYAERELNDPIRADPIDFGTHFLSEGYHYLTFKCTGKDPRSPEYLLGADNLTLRPITPFEPQGSAHAPDMQLDHHDLVAYPNPVEGAINLSVGTDNANQLLNAEIVDALGVVRATFASVQVSSDGELKLHVGDLVPGHYYLRLSTGSSQFGMVGFVKF